MLSFSWRRFFQAKCVGGEWFLLKMERTAGFAGDETQPKKREARHCDNVSSIFQNCWSCMAHHGHRVFAPSSLGVMASRLKSGQPLPLQEIL